MFTLLILLFGLSSVTSSHKFYRSDYTYVEEYDSFYKLHLNNIDGNWSTAFQTCEEEGAELFYPKGSKEWNVPALLMEILQLYPQISFNKIFVGLREKFEECEFSVMKVSTNSYPKWSFKTYGGAGCVTMDRFSGELTASECSDKTAKNFVCKKTVSESSCPTSGYKYSEETGKCYKFHTKPKNWCNAMETCLAEGGSLLMIENANEAKFFEYKDLHDKSHYVGVKRRSSDYRYYTVTGDSPNYAGLVNELNLPGKGACATIWNNDLHLDAAHCYTMFRFICEIKVSE